MTRLHLPALALAVVSISLLLLLPAGEAWAGGTDRAAQLQAAIDDAVDERGVPTPAQFPMRLELARLHLDGGDEDAATEQLRVAAELGTLDPELTLWLARRELADGRTAAATHHLRSVVEREQSSEASLLLAEIFRQRGRHKVAMDHARRAADFAGSDDELVRSLEFFIEDAEAVGIHTDAADAAQQLMDLEPENWRHPWRLARSLAARGKTDEAVEVLVRAVELADSQGGEAWLAHRDLGLVLVAEDRYDEARPYLESFLATDSSDADAQAALAQVEERLGDAAAAEARARNVLDTDPSHAGAHLVMGRIQAASGDLESARTSLEAALAGAPDSKKVHYQLSLACARLRDRDCAERHLALYQELQNAAENVVEMTQVAGDHDGR